MSTYAVGDEMTLQAIARDAASTDPAQPHLDHYPRPYFPLVGDPSPVGRIEPATIPQGWQCPVCRRVWAPWKTFCDCDVQPKAIIGDDMPTTDKEDAE